MRIIVVRGLYWGPPFLGNYHIRTMLRWDDGKENANYNPGLRSLGLYMDSTPKILTAGQDGLPLVNSGMVGSPNP